MNNIYQWSFFGHGSMASPEVWEVRSHESMLWCLEMPSSWSDWINKAGWLELEGGIRLIWRITIHHQGF